MTPAWLTVVTLVVGVLAGFGGTYLNERAKERQARRFRWDQPLFEISKEFLATSREMLQVCRNFAGTENKDAAARKVDDVHAHVRSLSRQIELLASRACFKAARSVVTELYAVKATMVDGWVDRRADPTNQTRTPELRFQEALAEFLIQLRTQLAVPNPADIEPDRRSRDDPWAEDRARSRAQRQDPPPAGGYS